MPLHWQAFEHRSSDLHHTCSTEVQKWFALSEKVLGPSVWRIDVLPGSSVPGEIDGWRDRWMEG